MTCSDCQSWSVVRAFRIDGMLSLIVLFFNLFCYIWSDTVVNRRTI